MTCTGTFGSGARTWYDSSGKYGTETVDDPSGPTTGSYRVLRGGCWRDDDWMCESAYRHVLVPGGRDVNLGLRVAQVPAD